VETTLAAFPVLACRVSHFTPNAGECVFAALLLQKRANDMVITSRTMVEMHQQLSTVNHIQHIPASAFGKLSGPTVIYRAGKPYIIRYTIRNSIRCIRPTPKISRIYPYIRENIRIRLTIYGYTAAL
jgi:hypothetical protein